MNDLILRDLVRMLVYIRTNRLSHCTVLSERARLFDYMDSGRYLGYVDALRTAGIITFDQSQLLQRLYRSALSHADRPFPDKSNAGPFIYLYLLADRNAEAVKQQGHAIANSMPAG
ncbi:hypothetical protein D9M68_355990 [compost metagenome]